MEAEEQALRDVAEELVRSESWRPMEDAQQTGVLHSASQLFAAIKKSLQRCAKFVSRGEVMLSLVAAFQVWPILLNSASRSGVSLLSSCRALGHG